ncbi:3-hydroxybutyryl-CoA dehydratase [Bacterioplanes sanyensis]|uniref:MaoC/PaaZ C-terminal domain-containing protein n=1 Tax=Bacterioplanes sanyensis TaxID=1249553 RepID=UPI00167958D2|nr:MaoC/PaaZ C-terminal domain-containing protein [Bacterioplanes sanyensis]GGY40740.1 3-hydroxybutyryl-CoA dehydratase [Bacterioplanes sanyensis]
MDTLTNRTFDEIEVGEQATREQTVTERDLQLFAAVSGDRNPVHLDAEYAATTMFKGQIAHGMYTGALISAVLGTQLPGPGTIYLGQNLSFKKPVMLGDQLTVTLTVTSKHDSKPIVTLGCSVTNQNGKVVAEGEATVMAPQEKQTLPAPALPEVSVS